MPQALLKILPFLRNLLPVNKIAAWIVGVFLLVLVPILGANKEEATAEFCKRNPDEQVVALEKKVIDLDKEIASLKLENDLLKSVPKKK